jgi:hypothetical protein
VLYFYCALKIPKCIKEALGQFPICHDKFFNKHPMLGMSISRMAMITTMISQMKTMSCVYPIVNTLVKRDDCV